MPDPADSRDSESPGESAVTQLSRIPVWDVAVRVVHWWIVVLLAGLLTTGLLGNEWLAWHMRFGQAMLALVIFRIVWGFVGSRNARFSAFLYKPPHVVRYARSVAKKSHDIHASHNPLGGWMVILLLVALLAQAGTGLFTSDDILWEGPLASRVAQETSEALAAFHRQFWWVLVALSLIHIGAVFTYLALLKENLILPMLTGRKKLPEGSADAGDAAASTVKAAILLLLCGLAVWYLLNRL